MHATRSSQRAGMAALVVDSERMHQSLVLLLYTTFQQSGSCSNFRLKVTPKFTARICLEVGS